jgi:outer membrane protein OmpA-like peptidoglycan-associated protein
VSIFDSIQEFLLTQKSISILITDHTDTRGSDMANQKLSEQRAKTIREELINRGIEENRILAIGKGGSEPTHTEEEINQYKQINSQKFEQFHQMNRRIVIRIIHIQKI